MAQLESLLRLLERPLLEIIKVKPGVRLKKSRTLQMQGPRNILQVVGSGGWGGAAANMSDSWPK